MFTFVDQHGYKCELSFNHDSFEIKPKHVLVLVFYKERWLCTINKNRGIEFPGGKVEPGETLEQAAIREVYEETAVQISDLKWFAHYVVHAAPVFCKAVFTGKVEKIDEFKEQYETLGKTWLTTEELKNHPSLSFYMKDEGMKRILLEVKYHERKW